MESKTKGSWLIHHYNKLRAVLDLTEYDNILISGKAGVLLSAISADKETVLNNERLEALSQASGVHPKMELPTILDTLQTNQLIDKSDSGVAVLGLTSHSVLNHVSSIFDKMEPTSEEVASLHLAEKASNEPIKGSEVAQEISDTFKLSNDKTKNLLANSEEIGFVDADNIGNKDKLFFNGNLFKRDSIKKTAAVLESLSSDERTKLTTLNDLLSRKACVDVSSAKKIIGSKLFEKVCSVGLYDINVVSNSDEEVAYLTAPSAFSKYSDAQIDDAFDLAKAFVSSITYGMTKSQHARGQIRMVEALLNALIRGDAVGPVAAIGQDYRILEMKGVVKVSTGTKNGRTGPMMKLLKKDIGELALQVIRQGDVSEHSLESLPSAAITRYKGPETNRKIVRKKQIETNSSASTGILASLRKGGL